MTSRICACNLCGGSSFEDIVTEDGFDLVACRACGLIFVANPPDDEARAKLYSFSAGYHEDLVRNQRIEAHHEREAAANLAVLRRHATQGRLLDIGCSTGLFLKAARDSGWTGQGLEYSADSSRIAIEKHGLRVRCGELRHDTFAPASFDVVTMWDVIEHVPDPARTIALLRDVVAPEGLLVLKTPNAGGLYPELTRRLAPRLGYWGHAEPPGHLFQFSESTLGQMVRQHGFEVVRVHHQRIPITYSFGEVRSWLRSFKWAAYCALGIPLAAVGPWLGRGDDMVLVARRPAQSI